MSPNFWRMAALVSLAFCAAAVAWALARNGAYLEIACVVVLYIWAWEGCSDA